MPSKTSPPPQPAKTSPYTPTLPVYPANVVALLSTISVSEGTFGDGDNGYNVLAGNTLFEGYADHPRKLVHIVNSKGGVYDTTAAGRYQILARFYDIYKVQLRLPDFSPASQDAIAVQLLKECGAYALILAGRAAPAIQAASSRWASLPNLQGASSYGQPVQKLDRLVLAYQRFGGAAV